jgi:NADH-quinone oxidoreductase subunit N
MNPILISAVWGVVMMFGGLFIKQASSVRLLAITGAAILFISNLLELNGIRIISWMPGQCLPLTRSGSC